MTKLYKNVFDNKYYISIKESGEEESEEESEELMDSEEETDNYEDYEEEVEESCNSIPSNSNTEEPEENYTFIPICDKMVSSKNISFEEIEKNNSAIIYLLSLFESNLEFNKLSHSKDFKPMNSLKKIEYCMGLFKTIRKWIYKINIQHQLPCKKRNSKLMKFYNITLNKFKGQLLSSSILNNLLMLDLQLKYIRQKIPKERERYDNIISLKKFKPSEQIKKGKYVLVTNKTPNTKNNNISHILFENAAECFDTLANSIKIIGSWDNIILKETKNMNLGVYKFILKNQTENLICSLKIKFGDNWLSSDDSRIRHILCEGNPPNKSYKLAKSYTNFNFNYLYPYYYNFLELVKKTIYLTIQNSYSNESCPYVIISCPNTIITPHCDNKMILLKNQQNTHLICDKCNAPLCPKGCGRFYHGLLPCEDSIDEPTEKLLNDTTKNCPQCFVFITKTEGCNHMTCRCGCQFCWLCLKEIPKRNNQYDTTLHFAPDDEYDDVGVIGGCLQFT